MEDKVTVAKDVLTEILDLMGFFNVVKVREADEEVVFDIQGDDLGRIIGKDGSTLQALQQVLRAIINKRFKEPFSFVVDANDYREKRTQLLERLALNAAEKALHHHREVELEPMSANERRIIHMVLKDKDVRTESRGEKSQRHIVIMPAA